MLNSLLKSKISRRHGFSLIEIMIAVTLITLISAIAVPNLFRARKRSQATHILEDLRIIDNAIDQYAVENDKSPTAAVEWNDLKPFIKKGTRLAEGNSTDVLGNYFIHGVIQDGVSISRASYENLQDIIPAEFWSPYGIQP